MATAEATSEMTPPPVAAPPPTTPTLSALLPELLLHILECIPSTKTLYNFLKACPSAWRVYAKHSQPLLLRLARNRYAKPDLTADDIIMFRAPFEMPFMNMITQENRMTYLTDSPGRLNHSRCEKSYLLMGKKEEETWVQLPRWGELVERWDGGWNGREERSSGRLTLKRVRFYGEMTRFLVRWERWMGQAEEGNTGRNMRVGMKEEKVMERTTEMQCLEDHEELYGRKGRKELEWVVTVQRRRELLPGWGGVGPQRLERGRVKQEKGKKPVVKTVVKKEKRKAEQETKGDGNKKVKRAEAAPVVKKTVQPNGQVGIKPDPEKGPAPMPPPAPKPLPRFKLKEDDW